MSSNVINRHLPSSSDGWFARGAFSAVHHRRARILAWALAGLTSACGVTLGWWATTLPRQTTEDLLTVLTLAVATVLLMRLAWVFLQAAAQMTPDDAATSAPKANERRPSAFAARVATVLLAMVSALSSTASAASAENVSRGQVSISQSITGFENSAQLPMPDFAQPSMDTLASDAGAAAAPLPQPSECMPTPGWTSPAHQQRCDVLLGQPQNDTHSKHVVLRGQTLWSIAASDLPAGASPELIAQTLDAWKRANPHLSDPDVIHVGDILTRPTTIGAQQ